MIATPIWITAMNRPALAVNFYNLFPGTDFDEFLRICDMLHTLTTHYEWLLIGTYLYKLNKTIIIVNIIIIKGCEDGNYAINTNSNHYNNTNANKMMITMEKLGISFCWHLYCCSGLSLYLWHNCHLRNL